MTLRFPRRNGDAVLRRREVADPAGAPDWTAVAAMETPSFDGVKAVTAEGSQLASVVAAMETPSFDGVKPMTAEAVASIAAVAAMETPSFDGVKTFVVLPKSIMVRVPQWRRRPSTA